MINQKRLNQDFKTSDITDWYQELTEYSPKLNHQLIKQACDFIQVHNAVTITRHPTAHLGLAIADVLLPMNSDTHTLVCALILPTIEHHQMNHEMIDSNFHPNITRLIAGVNKMTQAEGMHANKLEHNPQHIDNLRKMLLAIIDDARIVLLKLAQQIIELQRIKLADTETQHALAQHTMDLYAPLANRLGMGQLKWQLEDFSFRYLAPETYSTLSKSLKLRRKERDLFINDMMDTLSKLLADAEISPIDISGRSKHIYSIHKKIQRKNVDFGEIYDASAVRILVPEISDCYTTLGIIHAQWPSIREEFDDYISQPKANGYQSIHTAVNVHETLNVEIQIRTHAMHESAELGVAAHWKYKEGSSNKVSYEEKIATLRQVIDWQKDLSNDHTSEDNNEYQRLFEDRVYVFTPQGDVYDLPTGATPLDFAYYVHTEVGNRCKGAIINGKIEPLTQSLKTGDRIEIRTGKIDQPSLDWLSPHSGYVTTQQARQKIKAWFRKQNAGRHLEMGQELWDKTRKKHQLTKEALNDAVRFTSLQGSEEFFIKLGSGDIPLIKVIQHLTNPAEAEEPTEVTAHDFNKTLRPIKSQGIIEGVGDTLTTLARCCKPIPGDDIIGYVTKGRGISIHKINCGNVKFALKKQPERLTAVSWRNNSLSDYMIELLIEAADRPELIRDITNVLSKNSCNLIGMQSSLDTISCTAFIRITVQVKAAIQPQSIIQSIQHLKAVTSVSRT